MSYISVLQVSLMLEALYRRAQAVCKIIQVVYTDHVTRSWKHLQLTIVNY